jgi:hypothetical protein
MYRSTIGQQVNTFLSQGQKGSKRVKSDRCKFESMVHRDKKLRDVAFMLLFANNGTNIMVSVGLKECPA